ncbi:MAG TPA: carbohydrate ABC transporter permease [Firmicutes bacterium]|nr:carbohydrate ABC transporter permease [Bacillota bacterium]
MRRRPYQTVLLYAAVIFATLVIAFPFVWLLITALKPYPEIYGFPINYIPREPTWEHFQYVFQLDFGTYFKNSVIVSGGAAILTVLVALLPAYATVKFDFLAKQPILISILICQMFPQIVFVIPFFMILSKLGLIDTYLGVIVSYLPFTTPIGVWLTRNFFAEVPVDIEEAAMIDGCSRFQTFRRIALPIALPGIAAVGIYAFLFSWSELMFSRSYLSTMSLQTIPVFLSLFVGQYQTRWGPLFAGSVVASIPPIIVFGFLQKYFIRGLTSGSVKG